MTAMMNFLKGVRVIDFTQVISGPYATFMLAQQGADVIKLELPKGGDQARSMMRPEGPFGDAGLSPMFLAFNSGKRSLALDLKHPEAKTVLAKLVESADVVIQNYKAGAIDRLGFGYEWAKSVNPNIIYCAISGFGQEGPRAGAAAYDPVIQANSGMMTLTGHEGVTGPTKVGFWVCDMATGMTAAFAVSAAIAHKRGTGEGAYIDLSMLDVAASFISPMATNFMNFGTMPYLMGNGSPGGSTASSVYETANGFVQVSAATDGQFQAQCEAMDRPDIASDPRFNSREARIANAEFLREELLKTFALADAKTWENWLGAVGVPAGAVQTIPQMVEDPQIEGRNLVKTAQAPTGVDSTYRTIGAPMVVDGKLDGTLPPAPRLGEHTADILNEIGFSADQIAQFSTSGATN